MRYRGNAFTLTRFTAFKITLAQLCSNEYGWKFLFETLILKWSNNVSSLVSVSTCKYHSRAGKQWCVGSADQPRRGHTVLQPIRLPVQVIFSTTISNLLFLVGTRPEDKILTNSLEFSSLLLTVTSTTLPWDFYLFKLTQRLTVSRVSYCTLLRRKGKTW
jgi:hypothetical protein